MENDIIAFDTETSGLSPWDNALLSIGIALFYPDGEIMSASETLIIPDPDKIIDPIAMQINGLDTSVCNKNGVPAHDASTDLINTIIEQSQKGIPVVGHNMTFDITFAMVNAGREGEEIPEECLLVDTRLLAEYFNPNDNLHLDELCTKYGINLRYHHYAAYDAAATGKLFLALKNEYPEIATWTASDMRNVMNSQFDKQAQRYRTAGRLAFDRFGSATTVATDL